MSSRLAAGLALCLALLPGTEGAAEAPEKVAPGFFRRKVVSRDGAALALYRYLPAGGGQAHPPVLLVPELGFGREAYDLAGSGLARFLVERGREVYVAELRGQGRSAAPRDWRLRELVASDLPAIVEVVRAARPGPIDVVAHGYSGTLVLAATARELKGAVGKVVALSTPVLPEVPNATTATLLRGGGRLASLAGDPEGARVFDLIFAHGATIGGSRLFELRATGTTDLGSAAAAELLGWMESGDLALADGSSVSARLAAYDRPTFLVLPLRDNFAHAEYAAPLREVSRAKVSVRVLTKLELMSEDYSHLSMLHGPSAASEVFAPALTFLDAADPAPAESAEVAP